MPEPPPPVVESPPEASPWTAPVEPEVTPPTPEMGPADELAAGPSDDAGPDAARVADDALVPEDDVLVPEDDALVPEDDVTPQVTSPPPPAAVPPPVRGVASVATTASLSAMIVPAGRAEDDLEVPFQLQVGDGPPREIVLGASERVGDVAYRLGALYGVPMDLIGQATGFYRLGQGDRHPPSDETIDIFDPDAPLTLTLVPNRVIRVTVMIEDSNGSIKFDTPIGTAVPVGSLISHLQRWLGLSAGPRALWVGGKKLLLSSVIEELQPEPGLVLMLKS